jgi:hypothetical protein
LPNPCALEVTRNASIIPQTVPSSPIIGATTVTPYIIRIFRRSFCTSLDPVSSTARSTAACPCGNFRKPAAITREIGDGCSRQ